MTRLANYFEKRSLKKEGQARLDNILTQHPDMPRYNRTIVEELRKTVPLGVGWDKVVYPHPNDPSKVVSLIEGKSSDDTDSGAMKRKYYAIKLARLLAPEIVPDVHLATSEPPMIVRGRVSRSNGIGTEVGNEEPIMHAKNQMGRNQISYDTNPANFVIDSNGKAQYVDDPVFSDWALRDVPEYLAGADQDRAKKIITRMKAPENRPPIDWS